MAFVAETVVFYFCGLYFVDLYHRVGPSPRPCNALTLCQNHILDQNNSSIVNYSLTCQLLLRRMDVFMVSDSEVLGRRMCGTCLGTRLEAWARFGSTPQPHRRPSRASRGLASGEPPEQLERFGAEMVPRALPFVLAGGLA